MNIVLAPRAARDLRAIAAYIRKENPPAAQTVLAAIFASIDALSEHPRLGRQVRHYSEISEPCGAGILAACKAQKGAHIQDM